MAKTRINKFIFQEENFFLRLKTSANNLKVKKEGSNYCMDFATQSTPGNISSAPVTLISDFFNKNILKDKKTTTKKYYWGELEILENDLANYYYLMPVSYTHLTLPTICSV